jgi:hypothetical protein
MGCDVFANGDEIACKAGDGKVITAFPDVCLSPPSPPTGPIPIPYPNTSFSRDMMNGSKTVKIKGQPVMLKDQSFYKTAPLGDEAATQGLGASVITHVITGKTYFNAWSMDVKFEGENVDRHTDLTTSNHASYPGSTPPFPNLAAMYADIAKEIAAGICPCCKGKAHSAGTPMNIQEWYEAKNPEKKTEVNSLLLKAQMKPECTCAKPTKLLPEPPCDVFYQPTPKEYDKIVEDWDNKRAAYQKKNKIFPMKSQVFNFKRVNKRKPTNAEKETLKQEVKVNHLTPKSAGGCPTGTGNLQPNRDLCPACRKIDLAFNNFQ